MKDEASPVSPDEIVVRLIWKDFYRPGTNETVLDRGFLPRSNERAGISVFRLACLADPTDALKVMAPEKRGGYAMGLVPVAELTALGLSVEPDKVDEVPGHALIPELSAALFVDDPARCRDLQHRLAVLAAKNLIAPADAPKI